MPEPEHAVEDVKFVGAAEMSRTLGISTSSVYTLLDTGRIRSVRFGGRRLIPVEERDRFTEELSSQAR